MTKGREISPKWRDINAATLAFIPSLVRFIQYHIHCTLSSTFPRVISLTFKTTSQHPFIHLNKSPPTIALQLLSVSSTILLYAGNPFVPSAQTNNTLWSILLAKLISIADLIRISSFHTLSMSATLTLRLNRFISNTSVSRFHWNNRRKAILCSIHLWNNLFIYFIYYFILLLHNIFLLLHNNLFITSYFIHSKVYSKIPQLSAHTSKQSTLSAPHLFFEPTFFLTIPPLTAAYQTKYLKQSTALPIAWKRSLIRSLFPSLEHQVSLL